MASEWDGTRGCGNGFEGQWIGVEAAKKRTVGREEWWKREGIGGRIVEIKQHDPTGPHDEPIWLDEFGDMYLGEWNEKGPKGHPVEHGFGVYYWKSGWCKGRVYVGNWKDGMCHGQGKEFWLGSAPAWIKNKLPFSIIEQKVEGKSVGRPYSYKGEFIQHVRHDSCAAVTLKDGTCRVGPWKDGKPVGDWWTHPLAATSVVPAVVSQEFTETQANKRAKRGSVVPTTEMNQVPSPNRSIGANGADAASKRMADDDSIVPMPAPSSTNSAQDTEEKRVQKIQAWLIETIGRDPHPKEMEEYAKNLYELGLHSVNMICEDCTLEDLDSFDWIKPFHKRLIKRKLDEDE